MESRDDSPLRNQLTRRTLIQIASAAAAGPFLLGLAACEARNNKVLPAAGHNDLWCSQSQSVFCKPCGTNDPKKGYDSPPAYGLFAFWLMLTTQNWDDCLKDEEWRRQLSGEFDISWQALSTLYDAAHDSQPRTSGSFSYTNLQLFGHLRDVWQGFAAKWAGIPAGAFYPGGRFLLQIARQFPQQLPPQPFLPETCKGTAVSGSLSYGLVALWLMLTTEDWGACLKDDTWRTGLASEFKLDPQALNQLYTMSTDPKLLSQKLNFSNDTAFSTVRTLFYDFLSTLPVNSYGGHPCSSGKTLLQIAGGGR